MHFPLKSQLLSSDTTSLSEERNEIHFTVFERLLIRKPCHRFQEERLDLRDRRGIMYSLCSTSVSQERLSLFSLHSCVVRCPQKNQTPIWVKFWSRCMGVSIYTLYGNTHNTFHLAKEDSYSFKYGNKHHVRNNILVLAVHNHWQCWSSL